MTWHLDGVVWQAYAAGRLDPVAEASVDAHVVGCADCRAAARAYAPAGTAEDVWAGVRTTITAPPPSAAARLLARLGVRADDVVLLSGRPESTRADTEEWLRANGVAFARLVLRPDADRRPARRFKGQALRRLGTPEEVAVVVDDDPTVVEEITRIGYRAMLFP